ncbi:hypothetical protein NXZ75_12250 [Lysinibacillus sphaericus]|uniref:hypothetical protein n=1 Tax=Lysinibacillus sphaericus TaxID=1421 RepID=UPI002163522B|nr:hypothetical protein [Lysinibacillus sphaericus]MCS1382969.1 hypothetical protein [Lysinibacillus sphaericus]
MKKLSSILTAALLTASIGGASSALAADSKSTQPASVSSTTISDVEVPNVNFIEEGDEQNVVISPFSVILETTSYFPTGQGSLNYNYKWNGNGKETVRVYVKNNGSKTINFKMVAPSGTAWISGITIAPGKSTTSEHSFGISEHGSWSLEFSNSDGSPISVDTKVRDGL